MANDLIKHAKDHFAQLVQEQLARIELMERGLLLLPDGNNRTPQFKGKMGFLSVKAVRLS